MCTNCIAGCYWALISHVARSSLWLGALPINGAPSNRDTPCPVWNPQALGIIAVVICKAWGVWNPLLTWGSCAAGTKSPTTIWVLSLGCTYRPSAPRGPSAPSPSCASHAAGVKNPTTEGALSPGCAWGAAETRNIISCRRSWSWLCIAPAAGRLLSKRGSQPWGPASFQCRGA